MNYIALVQYNCMARGVTLIAPLLQSLIVVKIDYQFRLFTFVIGLFHVPCVPLVKGNLTILLCFDLSIYMPTCISSLLKLVKCCH